jgi:hypothetical protein
MMEQRGSPVQIFADETSWRTCRVGQANELEFGREQLDRQVARTYRAAVLARIRKRMRFAAVHESANGTSRKNRSALEMSGCWPKADVFRSQSGPRERPSMKAFAGGTALTNVR